VSSSPDAKTWSDEDRELRGQRMTVVRPLRVLARLIAINIGVSLIYRAELVLFTLANLTIPLISLMIWHAALRGGARLPVDEHYLGTYFVVLGLVTMLTSSWMMGELAGDIRLGVLSSWLVRPSAAWLRYVANNLAEKILKLTIVLPVVGILWWIYQDSVALPSSPLIWLAFLVSTAFAAILVFALDLAAGALAFWFDDVSALSQAKFTLSTILSGQVVPLALMPAWSQTFVDVQPFRFMVSFPIEVLTNTFSRGELLGGLALQAGYVVLFCGLAWLTWRAGVRSYTAVGG